MKKPTDKKTEQKKQKFVDALEKLNAAIDKEPHNAIANLLALGDEFSQSLVLFDMMISTDTVKTLLIDDKLRIQRLCKFYGVKVSDAVQQLLVDRLEQYKKSRRTNVLVRSGLSKEREAFVFELEKTFALSQQRYKQK